jgi:outer membrane protein TolC
MTKIHEAQSAVDQELNALRQEVYGMRQELDTADRIIGQLQRQNANGQMLVAQMSEELRARDAAKETQMHEQLTVLNDKGSD